MRCLLTQKRLLHYSKVKKIRKPFGEITYRSIMNTCVFTISRKLVPFVSEFLVFLFMMMSECAFLGESIPLFVKKKVMYIFSCCTTTYFMEKNIYLYAVVYYAYQKNLFIVDYSFSLKFLSSESIGIGVTSKKYKVHFDGRKKRVLWLMCELGNSSGTEWTMNGKLLEILSRWQ